MKKSILALTVVGFLVGCGGGSSSNNEEDGGQNGGSQQGQQGEKQGTLKYPTKFISIDHVHSLLPIDTGDLNTLPMAVDTFGNREGASILGISRNAGIRHSHCEKGSVNGNGLVYIDDLDSPKDSSGSGSLNFSVSSGVLPESITESIKDCSYSNFLDGYLSYDVDVLRDDNHYMTSKTTSATLGTASDVFFINSDAGGYFAGATGYKGSFVSKIITDGDTIEYEFSTPFIEIFTVLSNISERYVIGDYKKMDNIHYKNYFYKSSSTGEGDNKVSTSTKSYEADFKYENQDFKLIYSGVTNIDGGIFAGSVEYELQVPNDPSKTVKITYDASSEILTFTKDGKSESKKMPYSFIDQP